MMNDFEADMERHDRLLREGSPLYKELQALSVVFLSVVDFMNGGEAKPWWKYTAERKEHMGSKQ